MRSNRVRQPGRLAVVGAEDPATPRLVDHLRRGSDPEAARRDSPTGRNSGDSRLPGPALVRPYALPPLPDDTEVGVGWEEQEDFEARVLASVAKITGFRMRGQGPTLAECHVRCRRSRAASGPGAGRERCAPLESPAPASRQGSTDPGSEGPRPGTPGLVAAPPPPQSVVDPRSLRSRPESAPLKRRMASLSLAIGAVEPLDR